LAGRRLGADSARHDEGALGAGELGGQDSNHLPVVFAVGLPFREIVIESEMDDSVGGSRARLQAVAIL
jgi:hypothetical protein